MTRRKFSREVRIEAVRLVTDWGVAVAWAALDPDVAESVLRRWMREFPRRLESFFSSQKTERAAPKVYRTRDEARADVFDFIERFDNLRRRRSKLGYLSPMECEARAMLA